MSPGDLAEISKRRKAGGAVMETLVSLRMRSGPDAAAAARRLLDPLEAELGHDRFCDMRLLVSELVTNSVRHAHRRDDDEIEVEIAMSGELVHFRVTDHGPGFEVTGRSRDDDPASGWGLFLVEQLADRWGVELNGTTQVWFELEL